MGLFYHSFEARDRGKNYIVLRAKPIPHIISIVILLLFSLPAIYSTIGRSLGKTTLKFVFALMGIFVILLIIQVYERRKLAFIGFQNKEVIKKGTNLLSFSHPAEIWMEK